MKENSGNGKENDVNHHNESQDGPGHDRNNVKGKRIKFKKKDGVNFTCRIIL